MLTPVGTAMLFRAFPPAERAQAAAVLTIPAALAPASGPVLGGYLVEFHSWHWIFLVNIPVGIAGLLLAGLFLREEKQASAGRLDVPGFLLGAAGLASVMYALAEAGSHGFGDTAGARCSGIAGTRPPAIFAVVELRTEQPMIDVRLLRDKLFRAANAVQFVAIAGLLGALFLLPLLLQAEKGISPLESGLTTFPQAIGVAMMAQLAGRLYPRVGPRRMMMVGMVGASLDTLAFLLVDLETSRWWIQLIMLARGWSFALALVPLQAATFATISPGGHRPSERGVQRRPTGGGQPRRRPAGHGAHQPPDPLRGRPGQSRHQRTAALLGLPRRVHRRCRPRRAGHLPLPALGRQGGSARERVAVAAGE